jgi:hypothetical protein
MDDFENSNNGNKVQWACAGGGGRMARAQFAWCLHVAIFVRWVGCCSSEASRTPAELTKHTYEVMDDFENSNHGNKVQWACAGGGGRMAEAQFAWCPHVAIFVRWVGCCSSEATQTPAEVIKHTYEMMDDFEYSNCGK